MHESTHLPVELQSRLCSLVMDVIKLPYFSLSPSDNFSNFTPIWT